MCVMETQNTLWNPSHTIFLNLGVGVSCRQIEVSLCLFAPSQICLLPVDFVPGT